MGPPKGKKKDGGKKKPDSAHKQERKNSDTKINVKDDSSEINLTNLFRSDELHELRKILKTKDLTDMPLILGAVILGKFDVVKKLIKHGHNVNELAFDKSTPLMWAVKTKNLEMIDMLISRGAKVTYSDINGDNIIFMALNCKIWDENSYLDFWNNLKKSNEINLNYSNNTGNTLLHYAVKRQWSLLIETLIEDKANVNMANAKGVTPLIMAGARNDTKIVNILMNSGAKVLKEDQRACTAICYTIANIILKNIKPPFQTLERLTKHFDVDKPDLNFESYIKRRLDLLISPPTEQAENYYTVINKVTIPILSFFIREMATGLETLIKLKVFERIKEAIEKHIDQLEYTQAILGVTAEILRYCNCCIGGGSPPITEIDLANNFVNTGGADACLWALKKYIGCDENIKHSRPCVIGDWQFSTNVKYSNSTSLKQLLPSALMPLFLTCATDEGPARHWLKSHYHNLYFFYNKFLEICLVNFNIKENEYHIQMVKQKIRTFKQIFEKLKKEVGIPKISQEKEEKAKQKEDNSKNTLKIPKDCPKESSKELTKEISKEEHKEERKEEKTTEERIPQTSYPEDQTQGKKHAKRMKRKAKALKAKMRSADVVERCLNNGKIILQESLNPSEIPVNQSTDCQNNCGTNIYTENGKISEESAVENTDNWPKNNWDLEVKLKSAENSQDNLKDILNQDSDSKNKELIEIVRIDRPMQTSSSDSFDVIQETPSKMTLHLESSSKSELSIRTQDSSIKTQNSSSVTTMTDYSSSQTPSSDSLRMEIFNENIKTVLDKNEISQQASIGAKIINLRIMLNDIIEKYESLWEQDEKKGHPHFIGGHGDQAHSLLQGTRKEQIQQLNEILPKLEQQYINKLVDNFNSVIDKIKNLAEKNDDNYKNMLESLENILVEHEIRGQKPFQTDFRSDNDEFIENDYEPDKSVGTIGGHIKKKPTYMELIQNVLPDKYKLKKTASNNETSLDELYLKEMSLVSKSESYLTREEAEKIKKKTVDNAYHLVNSVSKICESDSTISIKCETKTSTNFLEELFPYTNKNKAGDFEPRKEQKMKFFTILSNDTKNAVVPVNRPNDKPNQIKPLSEILKSSISEIKSQKSTDISKISRWDMIIKSLQNLLKRQLLNKGEFIMSPPEMRPHYTISSGGNFGDVELGLDKKGRPLAVKRVRHQNHQLCEVLRTNVSPLLGLQHTNILHYVMCDFISTDMYLITPLCEYNLGEYLMCLKINQNLKVKSENLVTQMLHGLKYLHQREESVVHGNLKPSNILIDLKGHLRLAEFGIYKALYQNARAPKSSLIWFARETYQEYLRTLSVHCTKASDIQVAGMLVHFMLTGGLHPFGIVAEEILDNIMHGHAHLHTNSFEATDLISWMLCYNETERPDIGQVLLHVYFWDDNKKWRFLLACAGINEKGIVLELPIQRFHTAINHLAKNNNVYGDWITLVRKKFPNIRPTEDSDTPTGLLKFLRVCIEKQTQITPNQWEILDLKSFILKTFPALPLSLFRLIENTNWLKHPVFISYSSLEKLLPKKF